MHKDQWFQVWPVPEKKIKTWEDRFEYRPKHPEVKLPSPSDPDYSNSKFVNLTPSDQGMGYQIYEQDGQLMINGEPYEAKPNWISVKDRLPEDDTECLTWCVQHDLEAKPYKDYLIRYYKDRDTGFSGVTHWMPLPKPPKEPSAEGEAFVEE